MRLVYVTLVRTTKFLTFQKFIKNNLILLIWTKY
jgi:hypothetical protein